MSLPRILAVLSVILALGCGESLRYANMERGAERAVKRAESQVEWERAARLEQTSWDAAPDADLDEEARIRHQIERHLADPTAVTLEESLRIAMAHSRALAAERDDNLSAALDYLEARHLFDPRLSASVAAITAYHGERLTALDTLTHTASGTIGLEYDSPFGTSIALDLNSGSTFDAEGTLGNSNATGATLSVSQPLLRGAGRTVAREPLTQAERDMVYRLRAFELFRQDFSIDVARQYYGLLQRARVTVNTLKRLAGANWLHGRAKALVKSFRIPPIDGLQAELQELQTRNALAETLQAYEDDLLRFKTFLGVPRDMTLDVASGLSRPRRAVLQALIRSDEAIDLKILVPDPENAPNKLILEIERDSRPGEKERHPLELVAFPKFSAITGTVHAAVRTALINRLDLATSRERLEDAERGVAIARNGQLPNLSLVGTAGATAASGGDFSAQEFDDHDLSLTMRLTIPFDRLGRHTALKQSRLRRDAAARGYTLFRDRLVSAIRTTHRSLKRIEKSIAIQRKIVNSAVGALEVANIKFSDGDRSVTTREVAEAEEDVLTANNRMVRFQVDHLIAKLELERAKGTLRIGPQGRPVTGTNGGERP